MRIAEITSRHRSDFTWIGECEHCGARQKRGDGYADAHYRRQVVPALHCSACGLNSLGEKYEPQPTTEQEQA